MAKAIVLLPCLLALSGCSIGYVLRAGIEEAKILWRREAIERLLSRDDLGSDTREKLATVLRVRDFAQRELGLRVGGAYSSYAEVGDDQIVHVVSAVRALKLEPHTWWFPIVGSVPYKGYFSKEQADREASALKQQGLDVLVRPSIAFSTLGWFDDPLLSSILRLPKIAVVDTVIHELLHCTSYLAGNARFDESFANFVGRRGAIAFFEAEGDVVAANEVRMLWRDNLLFSDFLSDFVDELRSHFDRGIDLSEREQIYRSAADRFSGIAFESQRYAGFFRQSMNNARLLSSFRYADRLRLFENLYVHHGDLRTSIEAVLRVVENRSGDPFSHLEGLLSSRDS